MWHLNFFGGLRASRQERTIERFRTQKTAALLALLALRGSRSREDVCALLWPDASPEASRNSLSAALSALRRDLGEDVVCADRASVALAPSAFQTDVSLFDEAFKAGDTARAVELYRGHLLPGFYEDPFPSLEREYQEKAQTAFKNRLEELEDNGEAADALELARRAASLFGDEERWFLGFMRAHYGLGDLDAALRAYDALGRFMRKNGDTSSETARLLAKAIRRDKEVEASTPTPPVTRKAPEPARSEVAPTAPIEESPPKEELAVPEAFRNNLPTQWTRFFGRETERATLAQWLESGQKLVTLSGAGGSGKTRLSLETLRALAPNWEGDIVFVPLASIEEAELVLPAIRDALGLTGTPDLSPLEQVERALRGRRALIFLDNFEQLVEGGAPRLQTLRERLSQATFLVTSRVLLQLPGEREFPVSPLPTPLRNTAPAEVRDCASAALFCDRAGLVLDDNNAESVGALCRRLDGIPLALELAAARAKVMSPAQILERLQKHPDFLQSRELGIPARHKTLRATIEWSTDLLPPDLRSFWTRLSLFHGGWTLDAAEKVASPGICEDWETLDWLTLLRECSLLFVEDREGEPRFRMLQTLREFGREQLQDSAQVEHAFFDFYLDLAQKAASAMQGPGQTAWLARLDAEQDNLRAALTYARDSEPERGLLLATALIDFWETRLNLDEGRGWIETFLRATAPEKTAPSKAVAPPSPPPATLDARARALSGAGRMASHSMELSESRALVEQGLQVARQSGSASNFVYAATAFARFAMTSGDASSDLIRARELTDEAVKMGHQSSDRALLLEALLASNSVRLSTNELQGLRAAHHQAISLARELKDEVSLAHALNSLTYIAYLEKNWDEAHVLSHENNEIARRLDSPWELLAALWTRSNVAREQGQLDVARAAITEEWQLCRDTPLLMWTRSHLILALSYLCVREGDALNAARLMGVEEVLGENAGFQMAPVLRLDYNRYRDEARRTLGESEFETAWREGRELSLQEAVDAVLLPNSRDSVDVMGARVRALSGAGRMASHSLDMNESRTLVEQGLQAAHQSGDPGSFIYAVSSFTRFAMTTGNGETDLARARELTDRSLRLARQLNDATLLSEALLSAVYSRMAANELKELRPLNLEAISLARELKDEANLSRLLSNLAHLDYFEENWEEANELLDESTHIARRLTSPWPIMEALWTRSNVAREEGRLDVARATITEEWELCRDNSSLLWARVLSVPVIGYLRLREGDPVGAVRLWGAAEKLRESAGFQTAPVLRSEHARYCDEARGALGDARFDTFWKEGRRLSVQQAVDAVLLSNTGDETEELMATRARALSGAGRMAWYGGDLQDAQFKLSQGLDAARQVGDSSVLINATRSSALASTAYGDALQARDLGREGVRLARESGNSGLLLKALMDLGFAEINVSDFAASEAVCLEAIALSRREGDERALAMTMATLAIAYNYLHRYDEANALLAESEALSRRLGAIYELIVAMSLRAHIASILNRHNEARAIFCEVLPRARDTIGNSWTLINILLSVAYGIARRGDARGCARIMGACESLAQSINYQLMPFLLSDYEHFRDGSRRALGEDEFLREWRTGRLLSFDQTIDFILEREAASSDDTLSTRALALSGAGRMAWHDGDFAASRALVHQGLDVSRKAGDISSFADAVGSFVRLTSASDDLEGDATEGRKMAEEAVRLSRDAGDKAVLAESLISLVYASMIPGRFAGVRPLLDEAISLSRELGNDIQLMNGITSLATVAYYEEQFAESLELANQSAEISRRLDSPFHSYSALLCAANAAREQGDLKTSKPPTAEILRMCLETVPRASIPYALFCASYLLVRLGDTAGGVQLMGAAQTIGRQVDYKLLPMYRLDFERYHVLAHETLGKDDFEESWNTGTTLSLAQAVNFALTRLEEGNPEQPDPTIATRIRELRTVFKLPASATPSAAETPSNELQAARARALSGAGRLAWYASDMEEAGALLEQGLSASQEIGDTEGIVYATRGLIRTAAAVGDSDKSRQVAREALALARASGDKSLLIKALLDQAYADVNVSELASASALSSEATVLARQIGDEAALSLALNIGAIALSYQNHDKESLLLLEQSEEIARRIGSAWDLLVVLSCKGHSLSRIGEDALAQEAVNECLTLCRESFSESWTVANCLVAASYVLMRRGEIGDGAQVMGGAEAMRERIGYQWMPVMMPDHEKFVALARETLGEAEFEAALRRGSVMTPDEVFDFAIRPVFPQSSPFSHLSEESLATRSRALSGAGRLAWLGSDFEASRAHVYQGLESARELGDLPSFVTAVAAFVRFAMVTGDMDGIMAQSHLLAEEAVERSRRASDKTLLLESLTALAYTHTVVSRFTEAQNTNEEAIALARELGDETRLVRSLNNQASVFFYRGDIATARSIVEESVPRCRYLKATWELTAALWTYSAVLREQGDLVLADQFITEAMELCRANPTFRWGMFTVMTTMSYLFVRRGAVANGVRLMGASEALRQTFGYAIVPVLRPELERFKAEALAALGRRAFDQAWKEGRVMTTADAMELALRRDETTFPRQATPAPDQTTGSGSSARSDEVQAARARALSGAGRLAWHDSDLEASRALVYEGLEMARAAGDVASFVHAVAAFVRFALISDDVAGVLTPAYELSRDAVSRSRNEGDSSLLLNALTSLGYATTTLGLLDESHAANEEGIALARELGDDVGLARVLAIQAAVYYYRNLPAPARVLADENVTVSRRLNSDWDLIAALYTVSGILRLQGQLEESDEAISETLGLCQNNPSYRWNVSHILMMTSYLFIECGDSYHAVCLLAASRTISESLGYHPTYCLRIDYENYKAKAYQTLGASTFEQAWEEGRVMTPEAAIELALRRDETTFTHGSANALTDEALAARSRALSGAGRLAVQGSDLEASRALVNQGLKAAREAGDTASLVYAVAAFVRFAMVTGDIKGAITQSRLLAEEAVARSRRENNPALLLDSLISLGYATCIISKFKEAYAANEEAIALARELGDEMSLARALNSQVYVYYHQGIYPPARVLLEESLELSRRLNSTAELISTLWALSGTAREQGELELAGTAVAEFLEICHANPAFRWGLSHALQSVSYLLVKRDDPANAIRLLAASQTINDTLGYHPMPVLMIDYERYQTEAQRQLGDEVFQRVWEEGRVLSVEAALSLAHRLLSRWFAPSVPSASETLSDEVLATRSRALSGAGRLAWQGSDLEKSRALVHEGLEAARKSGDVASFVYAVASFVRFAMVTGDIKGFMAQSRLLAEEAVARSRREGNKALLLDSLISLGYATSIVSQFRESYVANDEAIALARELGDETNLARALNSQGTVYYQQGLYSPARLVLEESSAICRRLNSTWDLIAAQWTFSGVAREQGDLQLANSAISEVLEICRSNPSFRWGVSNVLMTASYLFVERDDVRTAVRLMSASEAINEALGYHPVPVLLSDYKRYKARALEMVGEDKFTQAWEEGRILTIESAIGLALQR